jgi:peptidoglycan L-alanyl-D-glutamate endopeptidase CwlK
MQAAIVGTPIDFTVVEGVRTIERQQYLYAQGRTQPGKIVTNVDGVNTKSNHQAKTGGWGYAVDLYPYINGSVRLTDARNLILIARHIKAVAESIGVKIEWGGDWKMKDYPHFEVIDN